MAVKLFALALAGAVTVMAPPASAQTQGGGGNGATGPKDSVTLKDGAVLRGTITELKEGSHVLLQLETGQVARIRWDGIARVDRAGAPPPSASPAPNVLPPPSGVGGSGIGAPIYAPQFGGSAAGETVVVHIDTPKPVQLEMLVGRDWQVVCESPCDSALPLSGAYRISGVRTSGKFVLTARPGDRVVLSVNPASSGAFVGGIVLLSVGGLSLITGLFTYAIGAAETSISYDASGYSTTKTGDSTKTVGAAMMLIGVAGIAVGIPLMAINKSTKVEQQLVPGSQPQGQPVGPAQASRVPEEGASRDVFAAGLPKPFVAPLTFHF